jgi:hypothetical protein
VSTMSTQIQSPLIRLVVALALVALPRALPAQANVGCASSPTNPHAAAYRDGYGAMVSRTDPASVADRARLGLPTLANNQVVIVSDTTICRIASAAYDSVFSAPAPSEAPLVLKLNTQYVVVKGFGNPHGRQNVLFNQAFTIAQKTIWY